MRAFDLNVSTRRAARGASSTLLGLFVAIAFAGPVARAADPDPAMEARIAAMVPRLETYIAAGMTAFDSPGLAIGIVAGDKLVYAKGFGVRKKGGEPVDTRTVFQIGSVTKGFLATTLAIAVDRGKFRWDDRVVDLDPEFQLKDPWVTREFRMFDLLAQRSGCRPTSTTCSTRSASTGRR
jgi:CubicO group peptidase (beta-lactamase class C family)